MLAAALKGLYGTDIPEPTLSLWAGSNEEVGSYPEGLLKAAQDANGRPVLMRDVTESLFKQLQRRYCLLLLISTGPTYGHWVMSIPTDDERIVIDDPWDKNYWNMSIDQLMDCWRWRFPCGTEYIHTAVVLSQLVYGPERDENTALPARPWYLPKLADFPPDFVWSEAAIAAYRPTD